MDKKINTFTIEQLEKIMITRGAVIRAIPMEVTHVLEKCHADRYPHGEILYLEEYKREMLLVREIPDHARKFMLQEERNTGSTVKFHTPAFFGSIAEIIRCLQENG